MSDILDMSDTVVAKSDQLNADDLVGTSVTVRIEKVRKMNREEQPVEIHVTGQKPWYPCKTMRRLMTAVWGKDGRKWEGQWITLVRDPAVLWAGKPVGGIRISAMTGVPEDGFRMAFNATGKSKVPVMVQYLRAPEAVKPAEPPPPPTVDEVLAASGLTVDDLDRWLATEDKPPITAEKRAASGTWLNAKRIEAIKKHKTTPTEDPAS